MKPSRSSAPQDDPLDFSALAHAIWLHPRETVRTIVDQDPRFMQGRIVLGYCLISGLTALPQGVGMLMLNLILTGLVTFFSIYATAWLLWLTGRTIGGQATFMEICAALTWAMIPALAGALLALVLLPFGEPVSMFGDIMQVLFLLWSLHLMLFTVAEVQRFSLGKSILNQLLVLLVLLIPMLLAGNLLLQSLKAFCRLLYK